MAGSGRGISPRDVGNVHSERAGGHAPSRLRPKGEQMAQGWLDKVKDLVKGNPQQADSAIEKVEHVIDERTGGKYADRIAKGSDALKDQLGLPSEEPAPAPVPTEP